ncbi:hypothetical protein [Candidatus Methanoperedens nitratireducens]|uniref:Peptidase propeptide domain-containing protein n=1 Tax=Candidatus Methanoperedens nitratireducens TaxID=1392998 RepID=A0A284VN48_9EURY|nr:hypothetical protein [Candidatus Methanoperedens nitroreducens]SNQ60672.1 conserved hypothetical protein [Candidatus Methanoperedens nitroreducens]
MDKKTLALLAIVLIVVGIAGLALSSVYSLFTGYSPQWGGYGGMGHGGMMGGGMMGGGMMGGPSGMMGYMMQMMGGNMLVSGGIPYNPNGSMVSLEQAGEIAKRYLAVQNNPDLELADLEEWEFNFYVEYKEKSTGTKAFQMLIDKYSGIISPEMGPNMMWNTKYGMMGTQPGAMTLTKEQATASAQQFLASRLSGTKAEDSGAFYGYYHFDVKKNNQMYGMLDVNGFSGQVWYHTWHGNFIREE